MKKVLNIKPFKSDIYLKAKNIVELLRSNGSKAYIVGGAVRDMIMGIEPAEYDICTSAIPGQVISSFPNTVEVGANFGVVLVLIDGIKFEVATFRKEENYTDGRHPDEVIYSSDESEDVIRRDFTINGLLYDPIKEEVIDLIDGQTDLENKIIKTIGDPEIRFDEDKLRMMRAVRFACRLNFQIEKKTSNAIKNLSTDITKVSLERIRDELIYIFTGNNPGNGLKMLSDYGLLNHILPEVERMKDVEQPPQFHPEGDVFVHTGIILDKLYQNTGGNLSAVLAFAGLLHDVGKPPTFSISDRIRFNGHDRIGAEMSKNICKRLKFSNKQIDRISALIREHLRFKDVKNMKESTLKRFIAMDHFDDHMELHLADCQASHGMEDAYHFLKEKLLEFTEEEIKPKPLIGGHDLIRLGYRPGPIFSEILNKVEEMQLEGIIRDKDEALTYVSENYPCN
jgi:poly(A) polymerase